MKRSSTTPLAPALKRVRAEAVADRGAVAVASGASDSSAEVGAALASRSHSETPVHGAAAPASRSSEEGRGVRFPQHVKLHDGTLPLFAAFDKLVLAWAALGVQRRSEVPRAPAAFLAQPIKDAFAFAQGLDASSESTVGDTAPVFLAMRARELSQAWFELRCAAVRSSAAASGDDQATADDGAAAGQLDDGAAAEQLDDGAAAALPDGGAAAALLDGAAAEGERGGAVCPEGLHPMLMVCWGIGAALAGPPGGPRHHVATAVKMPTPELAIHVGWAFEHAGGDPLLLRGLLVLSEGLLARIADRDARDTTEELQPPPGASVEAEGGVSGAAAGAGEGGGSGGGAGPGMTFPSPVAVMGSYPSPPVAFCAGTTSQQLSKAAAAAAAAPGAAAAPRAGARAAPRAGGARAASRAGAGGPVTAAAAVASASAAAAGAVDAEAIDAAGAPSGLVDLATAAAAAAAMEARLDKLVRDPVAERAARSIAQRRKIFVTPILRGGGGSSSKLAAKHTPMVASLVALLRHAVRRFPVPGAADELVLSNFEELELAGNDSSDGDRDSDSKERSSSSSSSSASEDDREGGKASQYDDDDERQYGGMGWGWSGSGGSEDSADDDPECDVEADISM